ncbi:MAG: adenylate kinase [Chloroflexi bacterium]|nr:adenylate kinase [Chloroflexota bacterium]
MAKQPVNVVFLGPPGSGKGTQSRLVAADFGIPHVDTGELLRVVAQEPTETGQMVKHFLDRGMLVPEKVVADIIERRLSEPDCAWGFVLDGFPRTMSQAGLFDAILKKLGRTLAAAVLLDVPPNVVTARLSRRFVCGKCGAPYQSPRDGFPDQAFCQRCGSKLEIRSDDRPEVINRRLGIYARETAPLIDSFDRQGVLVRVDGTGKVEDVFARIKSELSRRLGQGFRQKT